ncbi:MAG: putative transport system permease protein, partial [Mycobacteriales bacterium]
MLVVDRVRISEPQPGRESAGPPPLGGAAAPPRRRRSGTLLLPPWTRAPLLALGEPAVIFAVLAATIILACASSSAALFLSSAASESLHRTIAADCPNASYPSVQLGPFTSVGPERTDVLDPAYSAVAPDENVEDLAALDAQGHAALVGAGYPAPVHTAVIADPAFVGPTFNPAHRGRLIYQDGATRHIEPISRGPARGIWVPRSLATILGLRAGQTVPMTYFADAAGPLPTVTVPVAGIYRDLTEQSISPYWCSHAALLQAGLESRPPPLLIATDAATFARVQQVTGDAATHYWASPIDTGGLTLSDARAVVAGQADAYRRFGYPPPEDLGAQNSGSGQMPVFALQTSLVRDGLRGPVVPIALGGTVLALLLVGAAGSYWADRRHREVRLLSSRGVSPAALARKAVLELAAPAVAGTLIGWQVARWLVRAVGPNPHLDQSAPGQALRTAGLALAAGLVLLALVAGQRSRAATERPVGGRRSRLAAVPWEVLLLAAAGVTYLRLRGGDAVVLDRNVAQINLLVVAFPLLFLVGATALAMRAVVLGVGWSTTRAGRRWPSWYLASRRITSARLTTVSLLVAAAMPIAMLVYAAALTQTSQRTVNAKYQVFVGSSSSARTIDPLTTTPETARVGTIVTRYLYGQAGGHDVTVLAIDPDTFARTAFWDGRFADLPLARLLDRIRQPGADGRVPAIFVPGDEPLPALPDIRLGTSTARLTPAATARQFPGRRLPTPMLIVSAARLGPVDPHAGTLNELWTTGSAASADAAVIAQHARVYDLVQQ